MLIKEYRIPLPLTVEEYRIAQLYMIAKKSREESKGAGSGVEILVNEPYSDGPGGKGQYTHKIYHVGSHLPGWLKSILPKSALQVEEEAWNAYPYTKTRYTCPFIDRFSLEIETKYLPDAGHQDNVFDLNTSDMRARIIDCIDVVKDQTYGSDYLEKEDPTVYRSEKTGRGPLNSSWLEDYGRECVGKPMPTASGKAIMCAYKLCRVEFRYWGMQSKIENFIHDVALRKTMLRGHQQAWVWQDEWHGLTLEDIRRIERETQAALARTMGGGQDAGGTPDTPPNSDTQPYPVSEEKSSADTAESGKERSDQLDTMGDGRKKVWSRSSSKSGLSTLGKDAVRKSLDLQMSTWRMESIRRDSDTSSDDDDEFFDCHVVVTPPRESNRSEEVSETSLTRWSSLELVPGDLDTPSKAIRDDSIFSSENIGRSSANERSRSVPRHSLVEASPSSQHQHSMCPTTILILVFHAGSVLDPSSDLTAKRSDLLTFRAALESVSRQHYPALQGHVVTRLVPCPPLPQEALAALSSMSPYSFDVSPSAVDSGVSLPRDAIPVGAIPLLMTSSHDYGSFVNDAIKQANQQYHEFLNSSEGTGFSGQICIVGDSVGAILAYDALCRASPSDFSVVAQDTTGPSSSERIPAGKLCQRSLSDVGASAVSHAEALMKTKGEPHLDFEVDDIFLFGSPLAIVLAHRKIGAGIEQRNAPPMRPWVGQLYNLFHPSDPLASRLEPLLSAKFSLLQPLTVPRYQKYPLGDGRPLNILEYIQSSWALFAGDGSVASCSPSRLTINTRMRRISDSSVHSLDPSQLHSITQLASRWWGKKRLDFALYCPDGLASFPSNALPHLFHASFWESQDVMAFICRQLVRNENLNTEESLGTGAPLFTPTQPKEKWLRKRTSVKLKNVAANHRANDVIAKEGSEQAIIARFMYGPLDMVALTGEKVDIHLMKNPPGGEWTFLSTEVTDKNGRVSYVFPKEHSLGYGMYPVKCVVRGDHTCIDFYLMVIPPKTECVVFSIDGSFTASVSVTGRDPKVRPGAVDVVRHWQEMGYVIVYITGRPDMQQQQVVSWLAQHNFPHGLVSFADGLSTDPLGHKADYLRKLIKEMDMVIHAGYGSSKDISVYSSVGLKPDSIFVVGKVSRKQQHQAHVLSDGYAMHLGELPSLAISRPSQCNARMLIQTRGCFGLPGQRSPVRRQSNPFTEGLDNCLSLDDWKTIIREKKYPLLKSQTIPASMGRMLTRTGTVRSTSLPREWRKQMKDKKGSSLAKSDIESSSFSGRFRSAKRTTSFPVMASRGPCHQTKSAKL